jgi:hypothetical protein
MSPATGVVLATDWNQSMVEESVESQAAPDEHTVT